MNAKNIHLNLAVELANLPSEKTTLSTIRKVLEKVADVGRFMGSKMVKNKSLGDDWTDRQISLKYENFTMDVDLLANKVSKSQVLKGYRIK